MKISWKLVALIGIGAAVVGSGMRDLVQTPVPSGGIERVLTAHDRTNPDEVTDLDGDIRGITSLAGIDRFSALESVSLSSWENSGAWQTHPLTTMDYGWCGSPGPTPAGPGNRITSLAPLRQLSRLRTLDLSWSLWHWRQPTAAENFLWDLGQRLPPGARALIPQSSTGRIPLSLEPLASIPTLQELYLRGGAISNSSALSELRALEVLDLWTAEVDNWRFLPQLHQLRELYLGGSNFSDTSLLASLSSLEIVDLSGLQAPSLVPLLQLPQLRVVNLMGSDPAFWSLPVSPIEQAALKQLRARGVLVIDEAEARSRGLTEPDAPGWETLGMLRVSAPTGGS